MSRPVVDPEWEALLSRFASGDVISRGSEFVNAILVDEWRDGKIYHGCSLPPHSHKCARESAWLCKFFLAGAQRTIARGTLQQCAVLYDAALIFFADYRTQSKRPEFNFCSDDAKKTVQLIWVREYFSSMVELLTRRNEFLRTADQRAADRRSRVSQRQHDTRTSAGRIEKRLSEIESKLASVDALAASINRVELLLATVLHSANIVIAAPSDSQTFAKSSHLTSNP